MAEKEFCLHAKAEAGRPVKHWFDAENVEDAGEKATAYVMNHLVKFIRLERHGRKRRGKSLITDIPVPDMPHFY